MRTICLYFEIHQIIHLKRYRFFDIGTDHYYYDDYANETGMNEVAERSYIPALSTLIEMVKNSGGAFKVALSISGADVAVYVERGAADIGVVGKDILLEQSSDVYELLDLGMGKCRMAVAGVKGERPDGGHTLRVATKFPNIAREFYRKQSREIDIIELHGSIEIAPILKMSDVIVDIVETGTTLRENNLEVIETVVPISARLIANKVSYKFNNARIRELCDRIAENLEKKD